MITEKDLTELEKKLKDKTIQRELRKRYKQKRFEFRHPILFKLREFFDKNKL